MDPTLIAFAVRAAFRLGNAGKLAFEQHARNKAVLLPDAFVNRTSSRDELIALVIENFDELCGPGKPCEAHWKRNAPKKDADGSEDASLRHLRAGLIRIGARNHAEAAGMRPEDADAVAGVELVEQWRKGEGPPHPWVHVAVTVVDLGLEFVSSKPELLGIDGNGAKVVGSIAGSLAVLIPENTGEFEPRAVLGERLIAAFLRGALQGVSENADGIFRETHLRQLVTSSLAPVIASIDDIERDGRIDTEEWLGVVETLAGPAARAAIGVIAEQPAAFLGGSFETEKAAGALARTLLVEAGGKKLTDNFSEAGLIALFKASAGLAAARPELFLGKPDDEIDKLAHDLFAKTLAVFHGADSPFSGDVVLGIATAGLDAFKENAAAVLGAHDDWDEVVSAAVAMVVDGLEEGFLRADGQGLEDVLTREDLVELGRVFLAQVAENPKMVVGTARDAQGGEGRTREVKQVVSVVARAMAADENLLLSGGDWILIADAAIQQAAENPGPLFGLDADAPEDAVALSVITTLLAVAHEGVDRSRREHGQVMFGATLRDAVIDTLELVPLNLALLGTRDGNAELEHLVRETRDHVQANKDRLGSRQWSSLYVFLLRRLLADGSFKMPAAEEIETILLEG